MILILCENSDANTPARTIDIINTPIDELVNLTVTSVSRKEQKIQATAAAIYVLSGEDIRRSGVTSIPDALRLVPGVHVARDNSGKWAVGIRGFAARTNNKLLVLVDGRTIYSPLFAGVFWEIRDLMLEDIERIELIRGPGGTIWGANAVNGVINIITKDAGSTSGSLVSAGVGTADNGFVSARHGWQLGSGHYMRVYGKFFDRDEGVRVGGAHDDSHVGRFGMRIDSELGANDRMTFWGNFYRGIVGEDNATGFTDLRHYGANAQFRWDRNLGDGEKITLQGFFEHTRFDNNLLDEMRDTVDFEFQHQFSLLSNHHFNWGLGYRVTTDDFDGAPALELIPSERTDDLASAFIQDEISLIDRVLTLTIGSKVEYNDYTGAELQPGLSLSWSPRTDVTFWSSVSRAVRTPSRLEVDFVIPGTSLRGADMDSEELLAYELGCRFRPHDSIFLDVATFYNEYEKLFTLDNFRSDNNMNGRAYGVETAAKWQALANWRLEASYSFMEIDLDVFDGSTDGNRALNGEGGTPHHLASLRLISDLTENLEVDWGLRYTDTLPAQDVPSYLVADIRIGWRIHDTTMIDVVAQNLLDNHHPEQGTGSATELRDSVYGKLTWRF